MQASANSLSWKLIAALALLGAASLPGARAASSYSGSISGIFSDPVLTGPLIAVDGSRTALDNTASAVYSGIGTNSLSWGTNTAPPGSLISSTITFTGKSFSNALPGELIDLGTITYTNGTSALESLIFGATFNLSVTTGQSIDPSVSRLGFVTTANQTVPNPSLDADFITFNAFPQSFNVYENATAQAELYGRIIGDPLLTLTNIALLPGQSGNGFIGNGIQSVPEGGSTGGLLGLALLGLLGIGHLARKTLTA